MAWLPSALVFSAISSALLATTFLYVWYAFVRRPYVLAWSLAWWAAVGHLTTGWVSVQHGGSTANWMVQQLFLVTNATLMLGGCWAFTRGRRAWAPALALAAPFLVWVALAPRLGLSFLQVELPGALLLATAYGLTSYRFLMLRRQERARGATVVAALFAISALHELDYPLLRQLEGFAPIGYALAASLAAAIALCLLVMILEQARASTQAALTERETLAERLHQLVEDLDRKVLERTRELETATRAAQDASAAKSRFLARMSHEIRTPLNGIIGVVELLENKELDREARELIEMAGHSAASLMDIVDDVLDFSKIEAGKLELEAIPFRPGALAGEVAALLAEQADRKGLELSVRPAPDLPERLIGDPKRLKQVLVNLVSNAIKFTAEGRVVVRAGTRDGRLRFEVEDTGIGLTEEARARIFEAFAQADSSTTRRYGGTGLGLAISQRLVERMGGELGLDSEPGAGSTFWFEIDAEVAGADAPDAGSQPPPAATAPESSFSGCRILLAEDDEVNALVASRMLERLDAEVEVVGNGLEAVASAEKRRYDLIFLDCEMPEMDGYTAVAEIRRGRLNAATPVVALTAHASAADRQRCLEAGMDDYVAKPVRLKAVERVLTRWLRAVGTEG